MRTRHRVMGQALALATTLFAGGPLCAAEWQHELAPYMWGAAMDGTTTTGPVTADVNASFGDILDNLELGFMGTYRASRERLSITVDAVYMGLGSNGRGPEGFVKADVDMDQSALEVDVGYEVIDRLSVFAGLRYNDLSVEIDTSGPLGRRSAEADEDWIDPVIGAHYTMPFAQTWSFIVRGDVGGFGVGSDFAWQGVGTLRWQASEGLGVLVAYRYIAMDYDNGKNKDGKYFEYDMAMAGPAIGFVFAF